MLASTNVIRLQMIDVIDFRLGSNIIDIGDTLLIHILVQVIVLKKMME